MIATENVELGHSSVLSAMHGCTQLVLASQKVVAYKNPKRLCVRCRSTMVVNDEIITNDNQPEVIQATGG